MRTSTNEYRNGTLWNGFDYEKQVWIVEGKQIHLTSKPVGQWLDGLITKNEMLATLSKD